MQEEGTQGPEGESGQPGDGIAGIARDQVEAQPEDEDEGCEVYNES